MKILNFTFGFLLAVTLISCTDDFEEVPSDKYTGKFPNAKNKNSFMPLTLNNFWIHKTIGSGMDTIRLKKSVTKNFRVFKSMSLDNSFTATVTVFAENDSTFGGYFASDSGVFQCVGLTSTTINYVLASVIKSDSIMIYQKEAPIVPVKDLSEVSFLHLAGTVYRIENTINHHDQITINNEKIIDVWEFKTNYADTVQKRYSTRYVRYFKKGVGLLLYEYVEITNGLEFLSEKKILIDYGLN